MKSLRWLAFLLFGVASLLLVQSAIHGDAMQNTFGAPETFMFLVGAVLALLGMLLFAVGSRTPDARESLGKHKKRQGFLGFLFPV